MYRIKHIMRRGLLLIVLIFSLSLSSFSSSEPGLLQHTPPSQSAPSSGYSSAKKANPAYNTEIASDRTTTPSHPFKTPSSFLQSTWDAIKPIQDEENARNEENIQNDDSFPGDDNEDSSSDSDGEDYIEYVVDEGNDLLKIDNNLPEAMRKFRIASALGHAGSLVTLALLHLGEYEGDVHNVGKAIELLRLAERYGQPEAHGILGFLHATGIADRYGVEYNMGKALTYWELAAANEYLPALMSLGFRYLYGVDVEKSCTDAVNYYKLAAKLTVNDPRYRPSEELFLTSKPPLPDEFEPIGPLRLDHKMEYETKGGFEKVEEEMSSFYAQEALRGDVKAQYTLGVLNMHNDLEKSVNLLTRAAEKQHPEAHALLGFFALNDYKLEKALYHFRLAAQENCNIGLYGLGMMHFYGLGGLKKNPETAANHLRRAAALNSGEAAYQIGLMYRDGIGMKSNIQEARRYFQRADAIGNIHAKYQLAIMELQGMDFSHEDECRHAVSLLKEVSDGAEWKTVLALGAEAYDKDRRFMSLYRYLQAAHAGIEIAQNNAAFLHEREVEHLEQANLFSRMDGSLSSGEELEHWSADRHLEATLRLYEMSGAQGKSKSFVQAGNLMYSRDVRYSLEAYQRASKLKDPEALFNLGWMNSQGVAGEKNTELAVRYWEKAREEDKDAYLPTLIALSFVGLNIKSYFRFEDLGTCMRAPVAFLSGVMSSVAGMSKDSYGGAPRWFGFDLVLISVLLFILWALRVVAARRHELDEEAHANQ